MTWRGSTTITDRIVASLLYLIPLLNSLQFAVPFFSQFPELQFLLIPLMPLIQIYSLPFVSLAIFFAVFLLVVRNENMSHFVRFNGMQAILLSIVLFLCSIIIQFVFQPLLGGGLLLETLFNVVFLGTLTAVIYSVVQSVLGRYAEIPALSDAVYMQVR
ncbi:MAG: Tic20 family protein [Cyanobacteria bacterium J06638_20]